MLCGCVACSTRASATDMLTAIASSLPNLITLDLGFRKQEAARTWLSVHQPPVREDGEVCYMLTPSDTANFHQVCDDAKSRRVEVQTQPLPLPQKGIRPFHTKVS